MFFCRVFYAPDTRSLPSPTLKQDTAAVFAPDWKLFSYYRMEKHIQQSHNQFSDLLYARCLGDFLGSPRGLACRSQLLCLPLMLRVIRLLHAPLLPQVVGAATRGPHSSYSWPVTRPRPHHGAIVALSHMKTSCRSESSNISLVVLDNKKSYYNHKICNQNYSLIIINKL